MEKFLNQWLAKWSGNKPQELLAFYHEDIFYRDPAFPQGLSGKEALGKYLVKLLARNPEWRWELTHFDQVNEERYYVKWKAVIPVGDETTVEEGLDLLEIKDGLILRNEVYFDTAKMTKSS